MRTQGGKVRGNGAIGKGEMWGVALFFDRCFTAICANKNGLCSPPSPFLRASATTRGNVAQKIQGWLLGRCRGLFYFESEIAVAQKLPGYEITAPGSI